MGLAWTVIGIVVGMLLAITTTWALVIGILGVITHERFVRCPRCHRRGLTIHGRFHEEGCPPALRQHLGPVHSPWFGVHHIDPRHHR